jgi:hypothetical protein
MRLEIKDSEKKYLGKIYHEVADLSGTFQFLTTSHTKDGSYIWCGQEYDEADKVYQHSLSFLPRSMKNPYGSEYITHVGFIGEFTHIRDFMAIEAMFAELTQTQKLLESGQYTGPASFEIKKRGKKYAYSMNVSTSRFDSVMRGLDGELKTFGAVSGDVFTNCFEIHLIVGRKTVPVANMSLWSSTKTAFLVAHDLAVIKALYDGRPEEEIRQMRPMEPVDRRDPDEVARQALEIMEITEAMVAKMLEDEAASSD